ncbi:MAG: hypothetical protein U1B80_09550, partial [Anaerolineaceae bacterium]|nr:hypothetical protein [Anaerolineaceae bacterium]
MVRANSIPNDLAESTKLPAQSVGCLASIQLEGSNTNEISAIVQDHGYTVPQENTLEHAAFLLLNFLHL